MKLNKSSLATLEAREMLLVVRLLLMKSALVSLRAEIRLSHFRGETLRLLKETAQLLDLPSKSGPYARRTEALIDALRRIRHENVGARHGVRPPVISWTRDAAAAMSSSPRRRRDA